MVPGTFRSPSFWTTLATNGASWCKPTPGLWASTLEFLPTYSPNLNLIERYWPWVKKQCLNAKYHPDFVTMKSVILPTTALAHHNHAAALASLLTWNFQLFPKTQVIN